MANLDKDIIREMAIKISVELDEKELKDGFEDVTDIASDEGKKAGKGFGLNLNDALSTALGVGIAEAALSGLSAISQMVQDIVAGIGEAIERGDQLAKDARKFGLEAEKLRALQFAGSQSGLDPDALVKAFGNMNQKIADARSGAKGMQDMFSQLGVDVTDTTKSTEELFVAIGKSTNKLDDVTRSGLLKKLFGGDGADLQNIFSNMDEFQKNLDLVKELSGGSINDFAESAEKVSDSMGKMSLFSEILETKMFAALGPPVEKIVTKLAEAMEPVVLVLAKILSNQTVMDAIVRGLTAAFALFSAVVLPTLTGIGVVIGTLVATWSLLVAGVDLFLSLIMGGKSIIKEVFDSIWNTVRDFFARLQEKQGSVGDQFKAWGESISNFFKTIFDGTKEAIDKVWNAMKDPVKALKDLGGKVLDVIFGGSSGGSTRIRSGVDGPRGSSTTINKNEINVNTNDPNRAAREVARKLKNSNSIASAGVARAV